MLHDNAFGYTNNKQQAGIENVTMTGLSKPWLYWIPSFAIWWSVACYTFPYISQECADSVFGNCMQHDPTECTQISNSLHCVLYQERVSYVVLSAAWIVVIIISGLNLGQFSHSTWNIIIKFNWIIDLRNHTVFIMSVNKVFISTRKRDRKCC